jgi:hypothetical protein
MPLSTSAHDATVCCLLMQKDEHELLPLWLRHHGGLFGYGNLYVYDNGSGPETLAILRAAERDHGVQVDYEHTSPRDFEDKGRIFAARISRWAGEGRARFYFPLDCDEFVGVRIGSVYSCSPDAVARELSLLPSALDAAFAVGERLDNSWHDACVFHRVPRLGKLFFGNTLVEGLDVGFHECTRPRRMVSTQLVYFHLHHRPYDDMVARARHKMQLRLSSVEEITPEKMRDYQGLGDHLKRCLTLTEVEFDAWLSAQPTQLTPALRDRLAALGLNFPWVP